MTNTTLLMSVFYICLLANIIIGNIAQRERQHHILDNQKVIMNHFNIKETK